MGPVASRGRTVPRDDEDYVDEDQQKRSLIFKAIGTSSLQKQKFFASFFQKRRFFLAFLLIH
jgi:hypothetical protein